MRLTEALMVTLYLLKGKVRTQFSWNLYMFLIYMWCTDEIKIRPLKYVPTHFGPWCPKIQKTIQDLHDRGHISSDYSDLEYVPEIDNDFNEEFFDENIAFMITSKGEKYVEKIADVYEIDLTLPKFYRIFNYIEEVDVPFLVSVIKEQYPKMVKIRRRRTR